MPRLARELLGDAERVEEETRSTAEAVFARSRAIIVARRRRTAARYAAPVLLATERLGALLDHSIMLAECADILVAELGPRRRCEGPEVVGARGALSEAHLILQKAMNTARSHQKVGRMATEYVSGFAEAEMLAQQIARDLRWRDLAAADERIARLEQIERDIVSDVVAGMLERIRRRREIVGERAGGAWPAGGQAGREGSDGAVPGCDGFPPQPRWWSALGPGPSGREDLDWPPGEWGGVDRPGGSPRVGDGTDREGEPDDDDGDDHGGDPRAL